MKAPTGSVLLLASLAVCAACSDDPLSYSAPVGINLKAKSADTANGVVTDEKSINTESGNPYGAFVGDAKARIGRDPSMIDVDTVALFLGAGSSGATMLGEVFAGNVEVLFQMNVRITRTRSRAGRSPPAPAPGPSRSAPRSARTRSPTPTT